MLKGAKEMTAGIEKLNAAIEKLLADGFQKLLPEIGMLAKAISGVADNSGTAAALGAGAVGLYGASKILPKALPAIGTGTAVGTGLMPSSGVGLLKTLGSVGTFVFGMISVADSLDATLHNKRASEWNLAGRLGQSFGPAKEIIEYQEMIDRNNAYVAEQARIRAARPTTDNVVQNPAAIAGFNPFKPFKAFGDIIDKAKDKVLDFVRAMGDRNLRRLQDMAAQRQGLELNAGVAESETELARLRLQYMSTTPLGMIGALPELNQLNDTIREEMKRLQDLLGSIDTSTQKGVIESNQIKASILKLSTEERANMMMLSRAMLDSMIAESFGAGRFEKILITTTQNLAQGLEKHVISPNIDRAFVGSLTPSGQQPVKPQDVLNQMRERMPVKAINMLGSQQNVLDQLDEIADSHLNLAKQNQKLREMLDDHLDTDDVVQSYRQTRPAGRTALGGPGS